VKKSSSLNGRTLCLRLGTTGCIGLSTERATMLTQTTKPKVIICDIDGTVANISHRLHYISPEIKMGDTVRPVNVPYAKQYSGIVTGVSRSGKHTGYTVQWGCVIPYERGEIVYYEEDGKSPLGIKKVKSWRKFFEAAKDDTIIETTRDVVRHLADKYPIIFCSGRPEKYRELTAKWLLDNGLSHCYNEFIDPHQTYSTKLLMRPDNDTREDYIVKTEIYQNLIEPYYDVMLCIDDRDQVVNQWRKLGLTCWQVCKGDY